MGHGIASTRTRVSGSKFLFFMPTVFITGANRGLGLEFARQYAADGWRVFATCRKPADAHTLRSLGPAVSLHALDVRDSAAVRALAAQLEGESFDVFVANAGVMTTTPAKRQDEIDEPAWLEAFRVNAVAPLACACAFVGHVARSGERKMLAMSSWTGSISSNTTGGHYAYRASKAALNALWRSFALDHPEIIAAVLSPGPMRTDMTRYDAARWESLPLPEEHISRLRAIIARLTPTDSGGFFHFTGEQLPW